MASKAPLPLTSPKTTEEVEERTSRPYSHGTPAEASMEATKVMWPCYADVASTLRWVWDRNPDSHKGVALEGAFTWASNPHGWKFWHEIMENLSD